MAPNAKRVYFFSGADYQRFDANINNVPLQYPLSIARWWTGLFPSGIDAIINWGNGNVYFFSGSEYSQFNVLRNEVSAGYPKDIATNWPGTAGTGFDLGVDAAVNWANGTSFLFKGDQYLRYNNIDDKVDPGYPKPIAGNWPGISGTGFESGIDAAINYGNGHAYWFRGDQYIKIKLSDKTLVSGYPRPIAGNWPGVSTPISAAVEWPYAELAAGGFNVPTNRGGCVITPDASGNNRGGEQFNMNLDFTAPVHPAFCGVGEYRQYVRGTITIRGVLIDFPLAVYSGGEGELLPRPAAGAADNNFREDGATRPVRFWYGHRVDTTGGTDVYQAPDRLTGCEYRGWDWPGYTGLPGESFAFDIDFRGDAIDRATSNEVLQSNQWLFQCSGTL